MEIRYPTHPNDAESYNPQRLRQEYLIKNIMIAGKVKLIYTHHDRMIAGGVVPDGKPVQLDTYNALKSDYFLERRELGIINTGGDGTVTADGQDYRLGNTDCLYIGKGVKDVVFNSEDARMAARFYLVSTPAHAGHPATVCTRNDATIEKLGTEDASNVRTIYKYIHPDGVKSCQLVMGFTELKKGCVWNTMPAHTHDRRSEIYFYFNLPEEQRVFHFMGKPDDTRHLLIENEQGVISPSWSIHAGAGTAAYSFIWAMAGENQSFADMDFVPMDELK